MTQTYLALGDSYSIGEQVPLSESFPYQTILQLRQTMPSEEWLAPEILAKTGWTTDELWEAIKRYHFLPRYDFVSLLIGVNNQYRGRPANQFQSEFRRLLDFAVDCAGGEINRVTVLSIPDWGVTPFASNRDRQQIAKDIDEYNGACALEAAAAGVHFLDITTSQRSVGHLADFLAGDQLHPSGNEYAKWANALAETMKQVIE